MPEPFLPEIRIAMTDTAPRTVDRRRFVRMLGAGAGAAIAGPLLSPRSANAAVGQALKVGVMVPTGSSYSRMGRSLVDGLRLGLETPHAGAPAVDATLVTREVERGYGSALGTAQSLLDDGADVVVAGVTSLVAERLAGLFTTRRAPLIVTDVGAHLVQPSARKDFILHNSLLYWQASFTAGQWAAARVGRRAFVASALADSGYDTIYAFKRGFEAAGGTIVGDAVTHIDPDKAGLPELFSAVRSSGANVLYGLYSGAAAAQFVRAYARSGLSTRLLAGSFTVEDYSLESTGEPAVGVTTCASWTATRQTAANQAFIRALSSRVGRGADPFAVLGYDTAALIANGAHRARQHGLGVRRLVEALADVSLVSPRGELVVNAKTNTVIGPLWIRRVRRTANGLANVDVTQRPQVTGFPRALEPLVNGPVAGYLNEYLCA
jgi:branched-chain amino acid transport system substrate-binding protein